MALAPRRALGRRAVQVDHASGRSRCWSIDFHAEHGAADLAVDVVDGLEHALAEIAALVAIAQFDGLAAAGGGAGGHRGATDRAALASITPRFDGGVAARIEDFAGSDFIDLRHCLHHC